MTTFRHLSQDAGGGLLEDTGVSCCAAVATYVCTTWFPWGDRLIGYGCWSLSPICELSFNLDIVSPKGKTHHKGWFPVAFTIFPTHAADRRNVVTAAAAFYKLQRPLLRSRVKHLTSWSPLVFVPLTMVKIRLGITSRNVDSDNKW